MVTWH